MNADGASKCLWAKIGGTFLSLPLLLLVTVIFTPLSVCSEYLFLPVSLKWWVLSVCSFLRHPRRASGPPARCGGGVGR